MTDPAAMWIARGMNEVGPDPHTAVRFAVRPNFDWVNGATYSPAEVRGNHGRHIP